MRAHPVLERVRRRRIAIRQAEAQAEVYAHAAKDLHNMFGLDRQLLWRASFEAFDALPRTIRKALWENTVTFDPRPIYEWWLRHRDETGVNAKVVRMIRAGERDDLDRFAIEHYRLHDTELPHRQARVSIQRYDRRRKRRKISPQ